MNLNIDFFEIDNRHSEPKKGNILISEPFLQDNYFKRSIVLLTEHSEEGSVGFVLNKPVNMRVSDVIKDFPEIETNISIGGPVGNNTVHYIHTLGQRIPNSVEVSDGIYWGGDFETLKILVLSGAIKENEVKFFIGYSGWQANQLEGELNRNSWLISRLTPDTIMNADLDDFWVSTLKNLGEKYKIWINTPENPGMN